MKYLVLLLYNFFYFLNYYYRICLNLILNKKKKKKNIKISLTPINSKGSNELFFSDLSKTNRKFSFELNKMELIKNNKISEFYTDYEINSIIYEKALIIDKRTYLQYYLSLLKTKHLLIFSIYPNKDYNSMAIKIILFFFSFALYFEINALFFNDTTMHKVLEDNGIFNFFYQINQIIYSSIISFAITEFITNLSLTEKNIIIIKNKINFFFKKDNSS